MNSLDYLRGLLHAFGFLNMPEANLWCEFDIIDFEKDKDPKKALASAFETEENYITGIKKITEENFIKELHKWLNSGELMKRNMTDRRLDIETKIIFDILKKITQPESYGLLVFNDNTPSYIGIYFDCYLIKGAEKDYILHFIYNG